MNEVLKALGMTEEKAISILERLIAEDEDIDFYSLDEKMSFEMSISALKERLKREWIPVTERLPEEREWYLAVFKEKDTDFQLIPRVADYIGHGENKWQWINEEGIPQEYLDLLECIAWMPLPETYKAEKDGENDKISD